MKVKELKKVLKNISDDTVVKVAIERSQGLVLFLSSKQPIRSTAVLDNGTLLLMGTLRKEG